MKVREILKELKQASPDQIDRAAQAAKFQRFSGGAVGSGVTMKDAQGRTLIYRPHPTQNIVLGWKMYDKNNQEIGSGYSVEELNNFLSGQASQPGVQPAGTRPSFGRRGVTGESATAGSTSAGSIASVPGVMGGISKRPSIFGYVEEKPKKKRKKNKRNK